MSRYTQATIPVMPIDTVKWVIVMINLHINELSLTHRCITCQGGGIPRLVVGVQLITLNNSPPDPHVGHHSIIFVIMNLLPVPGRVGTKGGRVSCVGVSRWVSVRVSDVNTLPGPEGFIRHPRADT